MEIEGWFRKLVPDADGERLEIFLRVGPRKVRASGPASEMYELVGWFEERCGIRVGSDSVGWRRVRTGPKPMAGQLRLEERAGERAPGTDALSPELSSGATGMMRVEHDGGSDLFSC